MKVLSKEKARVLAEKEGWSLARAEGFIDGEASRSKGKLPSSYARVGIDDYCLGFRAGYYERVVQTGGKAATDTAAVRKSLPLAAKQTEGLEVLTMVVRAG